MDTGGPDTKLMHMHGIAMSLARVVSRGRTLGTGIVVSRPRSRRTGCGLGLEGECRDGWGVGALRPLPHPGGGYTDRELSDVGEVVGARPPLELRHERSMF